MHLTIRPRNSLLEGPKPHRDRRIHGLDIPTEILLHITDYLTRPDWKSLRLVSRSLHHFSAHIPLITELWFSPHSEDLSVFKSVCNHPFLGNHVKTVLYDITRFEDLPLAELRKRWPRPPKWARENPRQKRQEWIYNHPGPWQYLRLVEERNSGSVNEVEELAAGLKKLPNVSTIRLAFAFQQTYHLTDGSRASPLHRYSDVEWISGKEKTSIQGCPLSHIQTIFEAITRSNAQIRHLDLWQDNLDVPLSAFHFPGIQRFEEAAVIFSQLRSLTIQFSRASMKKWRVISAFRKLLERAKEMRKVHIRVARSTIQKTYGDNDDLGLLFEDITLDQLRNMKQKRMCTSDDILSGVFQLYGPSFPSLNLIESDEQECDDGGDHEVLIKCLTLPHLRELRFRGIHTPGKTLCHFLQRHKTTLGSQVLVESKLSKQTKAESEAFWEFIRSEASFEQVQISSLDDGFSEYLLDLWVI